MLLWLTTKEKKILKNSGFVNIDRKRGNLRLRVIDKSYKTKGNKQKNVGYYQ